MTRLALVDGLPETVSINGEEVPVETDFRAWVLMEQLFFDERVGDADRLLLACGLVLPEGYPPSAAAYEAVCGFYLAGERKRPAGKNRRKKGAQPRAYDFGEDWGYIYAAFLQQYRIDVTDPELRMHWWKFRALMNALGEETTMSRIIACRTRDLSKIKDRELRQHYAELKAYYTLKTNRESAVRNAGNLFAPAAGHSSEG